MHKVCPGPKWIYLLQRGIYTGLVYVRNTILIYERDKADTSYYKSLSPVTWKDGLMLMNVIRLICGPFSDSTISEAVLANPPQPTHPTPVPSRSFIRGENKGPEITQRTHL